MKARTLWQVARTAAAMMFALFVSGAAEAHALNPALLQLDEAEPGTVHVTWKVTVSETSVDDFTPDLPGCEDTSPRESTHVGVGIVSAWTTHCAQGLAGTTVVVRGLSNTTEEALLRVRLADGRRFTTVLRARAAAFSIPAHPDRLAVLRSYVVLGVEHIGSGADHLAFVLGLVLLIGARRQLFAAITSFTAAHSLTLALASLGFVHVPSALVEALIALSILFLAVEVARPPSFRSMVTTRFPWGIAFAFGLLHGFGFAGALAEVGLPVGEIPAALLAFNAGVELGQIAFVTGILALMAIGRAALRRAGPLCSRGETLAGAVTARAIGCCAAYWTCDRVLMLLS